MSFLTAKYDGFEGCHKNHKKWVPIYAPITFYQMSNENNKCRFVATVKSRDFCLRTLCQKLMQNGDVSVKVSTDHVVIPDC